MSAISNFELPNSMVTDDISNFESFKLTPLRIISLHHFLPTLSHVTYLINLIPASASNDVSIFLLEKSKISYYQVLTSEHHTVHLQTFYHQCFALPNPNFTRTIRTIILRILSCTKHLITTSTRSKKTSKQNYDKNNVETHQNRSSS